MAPGTCCALADHTDARYWNQIGPHGGWLAAQLLEAICGVAGPALPPRSLSVDFIDRVAPGPFTLQVRRLRERPSLVFAQAALLQDGRVRVQASATLALARAGAAQQFADPPALPDPAALPRFDALEPLAAFPAMFDYRLAGSWPGSPDRAATSEGWLRPRTERAIPPGLLAMLSDAWFPALWARGTRPPVTTVSMALVFAPAAGTVILGARDFLRARFHTSVAGEGFGDERGTLWWPDGRLAVQAQQLLRIGSG